jgi:TctA family transporter
MRINSAALRISYLNSVFWITVTVCLSVFVIWLLTQVVGLSVRHQVMFGLFISVATVYFISTRFETFFMRNRSLSFESRVRKLESTVAKILKTLKTTVKDQ